MFKKFDKYGNLKIKNYWMTSRLISNTKIYDCWLEDSDGYMITYLRTTKTEESCQLDELIKKYLSEGYSEIVRVYSTKNNKQLYPQN